MKSLLIVAVLSFLLTSCSHYHKANPTNKKNIIKVPLTDTTHEPKIGQSVKVFNFVLRPYHRSSKSEDYRGWVKEDEVQGNIIEVISNEVIKVELEGDYNITEKTRTELY